MKIKKMNAAGSKNYRSYIGPGEKYDLVSAMQFNLLTFAGLRENHFLLDIGCGSLRSGKLFIPYLLPGRYFGIEPNQWLLDEGIDNELGREFIELKNPVFNHNTDFDLSVFGRTFDFILAQSIFSHASKTQIEKCISEVWKALDSGGFFFATFVKGDLDYEGGEWVYPGCITYTENYFLELSQANGLHVEFSNWPHPNNQSWMIFTREENKGKVPDLDIVSESFSLRDKLRVCEERLSRIENSRYVKFGLGLRKVFKSMKSK